jgi:5,10-methylenetetrahydromethanopterin reductase
LRVSIGFNADLPIAEIARYAALADSQGFENLWMHEHSFGRDAVSNLSEIANSTNRIGLGFGCLSPYIRNPVALAMTAATLQETSNGRVKLGLGTGFPARLDLMGIRHDRPISALEDTIDICRQIWTGNLTNYAGNTFSVKNVKSLVGPIKNKIPIYIAGWKPQMLKLTAKHGDGYLAKGGESTNSIRKIVSSITSDLKRSMDEIDVAAYLLTLVADSKENAVAKAKKDPFVAYMLSVQDDYLYEGTNIDPGLKKPIAENYFKGSLPAAFESIKDEMIEAFTVVGTKSQVQERVFEYVKVGLNQPILQPILMTRSEEIRSVLDAGSILIETT